VHLCKRHQQIVYENFTQKNCICSVVDPKDFLKSLFRIHKSIVSDEETDLNVNILAQNRRKLFLTEVLPVTVSGSESELFGFGSTTVRIRNPRSGIPKKFISDLWGLEKHWVRNTCHFV
jgi:hypothetical protein